MVQRDQFGAALADADPDRARAARIAEAAGPGDGQRERLDPGARLLCGPADGDQVAVVHLAEEEERDVEVLLLDPLHVGRGARQRLLERDAGVADGGGQFDGDEGTHSGHDALSPSRL
jgi:hypothetical protein